MYGMTPLDLHAQYDVRIEIVHEVDDAGTECPECDSDTAIVEANTYYIDEHGAPGFANSCWGCVPLVLANHHTPHAGPARVEIGGSFVHGE